MKKLSSSTKYMRKYAAYIYPMLTRMKIPGGNATRFDDSYKNERIKVLSIRIIKDLIIRWAWVLGLSIIPAIIMECIRPGLSGSREVLIVFTWFWMIIIREGLVNTGLLKVDKSDQILFRSFNISPKDNFLGKFNFKIHMELIFHAAILFIFGVSFINVICLIFMTMFFRIIGEKRELNAFMKTGTIKNEKRKRNKLIVQIVCIGAAYGFPLAVGVMGTGWFWLVHPVVAAVVCGKALLDMRGLSRNMNYGHLVSEVLDGKA